jgi:hypothetical protein
MVGCVLEEGLDLLFGVGARDVIAFVALVAFDRVIVFVGAFISGVAKFEAVHASDAILLIETVGLSKAAERPVLQDATAVKYLKCC